MPIPHLSNSTLGPEFIRDHNTASKVTSAQETSNFFGEDGFTFGDIIDIINPLQHIPIVGAIYRKITGDTIAPAMQVAGGALFGGPIGAVMSLVTTAIQSQFKSDSTDPDSPYRDTTINPATVANNALQATPRTIGKDDYSATGDSPLRQSALAKQASERAPVQHYSGSIGEALALAQSRIASNKESSIDNTKALYASNTLQRKPAYQSTDGLMNLVRKSTEVYTNVVSSRNSPASSTDGIMNLVHKNTEIYTNVVSSTNSPARNIDVLIGSTFDAG